MVFSSKQWDGSLTFSPFLAGELKNQNFEILFPLSLLALSLHYSFGSWTSRRAIAIRSHCHSLTQFLHPIEGKCIVFYCCVDSVTTPPPISSRQLVWLSLCHQRSTREESKWLPSPPLSNKGHRGDQPPPFPILAISQIS